MKKKDVKIHDSLPKDMGSMRQPEYYGVDTKFMPTKDEEDRLTERKNVEKDRRKARR